jgi:accessory colonization factor AcfC
MPAQLEIRSCYCFCLSFALISMTAVAATEPSAQEVLHVYGSEGPFPPMHEATQVFGEKNKIKTDVVSGPTEKWLDKAKSDADVIFASAAFMMSGFVRLKELQIVPDTVTPLYMRPSAILVRPGNPKEIRDFPDLLKPGVRVMVVTGSGQTGLWEDMAGKKGDVGTIRALHKNIVLYAANSTEAVAAWQKRNDIDAWVTWSIWHLPLHDHADLVHVSDDYVIYRQCFVALTERSKGKPMAAEFVAFLKSEEGAKVFESWDWMVTPPGSKPLDAPKPQER